MELTWQRILFKELKLMIMCSFRNQPLQSTLPLLISMNAKCLLLNQLTSSILHSQQMHRSSANLVQQKVINQSINRLIKKIPADTAATRMVGMHDENKKV